MCFQNILCSRIYLHLKILGFQRFIHPICPFLCKTIEIEDYFGPTMNFMFNLFIFARSNIDLCWKTLTPYHQNFIPCFSVDIGTICKIFKKVRRMDIHHFPVSVFSKLFPEMEIPIFYIYKSIVKHMLKCSLIRLKCFGNK